jgi:hypothetical protein
LCAWAHNIQTSPTTHLKNCDKCLSIIRCTLHVKSIRCIQNSDKVKI